ncbi:MAG: class I adenylate-forming enzyme family protein [bacterium]|nr:class I adenylate-forming enzyme family protein [bacterium]
MNKKDLIKLKEKIYELSNEEKTKRDKYLRDISVGNLYGPQVGYPEIDKPWLQFYDEKLFEVTVPNMSAYDFMAKSNKDNMENVALYYFGKKYTYKDLIDNIAKTEDALRANGVEKGDVVTIAIPNVPENVFIFYALNKIGAIANMVDLRLKEDLLVNAITGVNSKLMFGCDLFLENINNIIDKTNLEKVVVVSPADSLPPLVKQLYKLSDKTKKIGNPKFQMWKDFSLEKPKYEVIREVVDGNTDACILYTSGTSGLPKGVIHTNNTFNNMATQIKYLNVDYVKGERFMNQVPPFLAYNLILSTHMPLSLGLDIIMLPNYEPDKFAEHVMKYKINHVLAGPADWTNFLENDNVNRKNLSHLKLMASGSDKINPKTKDDINAKISSRGGEHKVLEGYGQTEVGSAAVTNLPNLDVRDSVGVPYPKMSVAIFDDDNNELPYGSIGNICITGPTMMSGYYNNEEETKETMQKHADGTVWVHTGDIGYMDENGVLFLKGRKKRLIIRHDGIKISPSDIEKVVDGLDCVCASCVVGVDDLKHGSGHVPYVNVVKSPDTNLTDNQIIEAIKEECSKKLTEKYCIDKIEILDEFPLTPVGKVDYRKLEKICNEKIREEQLEKSR